LDKNNEIIKLIDTFNSEYNRNGEPIRINFREIVSELNSPERYSHLIHSYPAKLLCHIPFFFLQTDYFCPTNGIVLDPFCGTGTVMLEANISGRNAKGADANPLACLISRVKTTYIKKEDLQKTLGTIISRAKRCNTNDYLELPSISRWFSKSTILQLWHLECAIKNVKDIKHQDFFMMCLSNLVKKVSYADPSISVPVKLNPERFIQKPERMESIKFKLKTLENIDVYDKFENICQLNINRIDTLENIYSNGITSEIISNDARFLAKKDGSKEVLQDKSIDLILTSPPYAGAQKYIRSSWLNLYWLGTKNREDIRLLDKQNIGREDYHKAEIYRIVTNIKAADDILNSLYNEGKNERAFIVGNYLNEMKSAIDESIRVLKTGGFMIIVIGNNTVCGRPFDTQDYLTTYIISKGLTLQFKLIDDIKSYGLMTKRNKTASRISCEWILVFKK
jgi:hypothetical protein